MCPWIHIGEHHIADLHQHTLLQYLTTNRSMHGLRNAKKCGEINECLVLQRRWGQPVGRRPLVNSWVSTDAFWRILDENSRKKQITTWRRLLQKNLPKTMGRPRREWSWGHTNYEKDQIMILESWNYGLHENMGRSTTYLPNQLRTHVTVYIYTVLLYLYANRSEADIYNCQIMQKEHLYGKSGWRYILF